MNEASAVKVRKRRPPKLGNVEFANGAGDAWKVYRNGELVRDGLAFAQVLALIRGELTVEELATTGRRRGARGGKRDG